MDQGSHPEGFSATTFVFLTRVVKLEAFIKPFANEVEFGAIDVGQALGVDQDLDSVVFKDDILGRDVIGVFKFVRES
jgi:hypothetical protein